MESPYGLPPTKDAVEKALRMAFWTHSPRQAGIPSNQAGEQFFQTLAQRVRKAILQKVPNETVDTVAPQLHLETRSEGGRYVLEIDADPNWSIIAPVIQKMVLVSSEKQHLSQATTAGLAWKGLGL